MDSPFHDDDDHHDDGLEPMQMRMYHVLNFGLVFLL